MERKIIVPDKTLRPAEIAIIVYALLTALINCIYFKTLGGTYEHLTIRAGIIAVLFLLLFLHSSKPGKVIDFLRSFFPLATLGYFYGETDFYNNIWSGYLDPLFAKADFMIFGFQPSIEFSRVFHWTWFNELMNMAYLSYFIMIFSVAWVVYRSNYVVFNKCLFIIIQSFFFYYILFIFLPVMGPQFWFSAPYNSLPDAGVFRDVLKFVQAVGERPTGAFPSSHVGMSIILCYLTYRYAPSLFRWMIGITVLLACSAVYLKAHYFVDILGGILTAPVMIIITTSIINLFSLRVKKENHILKPAGLFVLNRRRQTNCRNSK